MRTFGSTFNTEKNKTATPFPFWTAKFSFPAPQGDTYVAGRPNITISSNAHELIVARFGEYGPQTVRDFLRSIEIPSTAFAFASGPVLSDGRRFSDLFGTSLESVRVALYLTFQTAPSTYVQEAIASMIARSPDGVGYVDGLLELVSLADKYLWRNVLREIGADFTFARPSDAGSHIPITIGNVPHAPARIVKGQMVSRPEADAANTGTGDLAEIAVALAYTPTGDQDVVTITFTSQTAYDVTTADAGAVGSGSVNNDNVFESALGTFFIRASAWSGVPEAGDVFTATIDATDAIAIVSESPVADSVVAIDNVYANGFRLVGDDIEVTVDGDITDAILDDAAVVNGEKGITSATGAAGLTLLNLGNMQTGGAEDVRVVYQPFRVPAGLTAPQLIGLVVEATPSGTVDFGTRNSQQQGLTITAHHRLGIDPNITQPSLRTGELFRRVIDASDGGIGTFVELDHVPVVAGRKYYLALEAGGGGSPVGEGWTLNLKNTGGDDAETDFEAWKRTAADPGSVVKQTGKKLMMTVYFRGVDGEIVAAGPGTRGTYYTSWDQKDARIFKSVELGVKKTGSPTEAIRVELLRGNGITPHGAELLVGIDVPVSSATGSFSRISKDFPELVFAPPGRYFLRVSGKDETSTDDDGNETSAYSTLKTGSSSTNAPTNDDMAYYAQPDQGFSATDPQYGLIGDTTAFSSQQLLKHGVEGYRFTGSGDRVALDFAVRAVSLTKSVSATDATGARVAQIAFDAPMLPDSIRALTADVRGINRRRPNDAVHFMLGRAGVVDADIDLSGSFAAAQTAYASRGYFFDGVIDTQRTLRDLLIEWQREGRALFDWGSSKAKWFFIPDRNSASAVKTLTLSDVVNSGDVGPPQVTVRRTPVGDITNVVTVRWNRDYREPRSADAYRQTTKRTSQSSIDALDAEYEKDDLFLFDFCRRRGMALDAAAFYLERLSFAKRVVEFRTVLTQLELEPTDVVNLNFASDTLGGAVVDGGFGEGGFGPPPGFGGYNQFDGLGGTDPWVIESVRIISDEMELEILAREL